jgi:hypothetical protein
MRGAGSAAAFGRASTGEGCSLMANAQQRARHSLSHLLPPLSPWDAAVLFWPYRMVVDPPELTEAEMYDIFGMRLGPLLLDYLSTHDSGLAAEELARLRTYQSMGELRTKALLAEASRATDILTRNRIRFAVSKGPGIARHYRSPRLRPYGDIDILLRSQDFDRARALLGDAGWQVDPERREQRDYFERRCREAVNLERGDLGRIDLHHHIPPWIWTSQMSTDQLVERASVCTVDGHEFPLLDKLDNFIICCLHIVSDRSEPGRSLMVWRDIIELGRVVEVDRISERADDVELLGWIGAVVNSLPEDVRPFRVPDAWSDAPIHHPRRLLLTLNNGASDKPIRRHLARLPVVPNGAMYVAGVAFPSSEFLDTHVQGSMKLLRWVTNKRG